MKIFKNISKKDAPYVIAELGAKYGDINTIKKLILNLKKAGADAVKIQTYKAKNLVDNKSVFYPNKRKVNQYKFFLKNQLSERDHEEIIKLCKKIKINWFSTPANFEDIDYLEKFNPIAYKIGSDDLTNLPLIEYAANTKKAIILSTGMSTMFEIIEAVNTIEKSKNKNIFILHCISDYPSKEENANLNIIKTLQKRFKYPIGLSDHTDNDMTSIVATSMGVKIIEKHVMPNNVKNWSDAESSLSLKDFVKLISKVKKIKYVFGSSVRKVFESEIKWKKKANKSLYLSKDIKKNELLSNNHMLIRRPAGKSKPRDYKRFLNKKVKKNIKKDTNLTFDMIYASKK